MPLDSRSAFHCSAGPTAASESQGLEAHVRRGHRKRKHHPHVDGDPGSGAGRQDLVDRSQTHHQSRVTPSPASQHVQHRMGVGRH